MSIIKINLLQIKAKANSPNLVIFCSMKQCPRKYIIDQQVDDNLPNFFQNLRSPKACLRPPNFRLTTLPQLKSGQSIDSFTDDIIEGIDTFTRKISHKHHQLMTLT